MYKTDLETFLHESRLEDFSRTETGIVTVSTIHKAKGREYDSVYLLIHNSYIQTDEDRRKYYVSLTRAKKLLHIHYDNDIFDFLKNPDYTYEKDNTVYDWPEDILVQLGHKDIVLDYSRSRSNIIARLTSGQILFENDNILSVERNGYLQPIAKFSKSFIEKKAEMSRRGFRITSANIRFIVEWKKKEDNTAGWIILPDVHFGRV